MCLDLAANIRLIEDEHRSDVEKDDAFSILCRCPMYIVQRRKKQRETIKERDHSMLRIFSFYGFV